MAMLALSKFNQLPLEILLDIFHYLDVPDIFQIRKVSWYLNRVTHRRDVWSDAYHNANFVRPPGPFPSQSLHDLENALVLGFRTHRTLRRQWSVGSTRPIYKEPRKIWFANPSSETGFDVHLVFGRFLFIVICNSNIVYCHDLNLCKSDGWIIHRTTGRRCLEAFQCFSSTDVEGRPFACAVMKELTEHSRNTIGTRISIYRLNVTEQSEMTLVLLHRSEHKRLSRFNIVLGPRVIFILSRAYDPLPGDWHTVVALDVHSRTQFLLPSSIYTEWEGILSREGVWEKNTLTGISTSTHLLLVRTRQTLFGFTTFFQAFAFPPTNERSTPLSLTHSGVVPGINASNVGLLHDATLDPSTQDTIITVFLYPFSLTHNDFISVYGTLRLHRDKSRDEVGTITFQSPSSIGYVSEIRSFHPSCHGIGRVFYNRRDMIRYSPRGHAFDHPHSYSMFEYDVRGHRGLEQDIVMHHSVLLSPNGQRLLDYDPYTCRMCVQSDTTKNTVVEIWDLDV